MIKHFYVFIVTMFLGCLRTGDDTREDVFSQSFPFTECTGLIDRIDFYDYLQGDPNRDNLIKTIVCEYDDEDRPIIEYLYDYLQGEPNRNMLSMGKKILWRDNSVKVIVYDYLQGSPNREYSVEETIYEYK